MPDSGKGSGERSRRASIPAPADENISDGGLGDTGVAEVPEIGTATVERERGERVMARLEAVRERRVQVNRW